MADVTQQRDKEKQLFARAVELPTEAQRTAFLREACGDDAALRRGVEKLLESHLAPENFIAPRVGDDSEDGGADLSERPGAIIGRYKLLERIGEGGFGVVFMAEQQEPVRRKVALKIIKPGMDTRQVIARFEAERQALALMDHPNIAKVLDGGTTGEASSAFSPQPLAFPAGRPYFVMELVRGIPVTRFCEENRLTIKERLELFIPVCHAIQHAHQKGVIHRDIKPSNVLVTLSDGVPHPMVIDFGVAKAIEQRLTEKTIYTGLAQMIGTPAYMSPEQAELSKQDVDTRADVYSLGILLYELLTGATPFPEERLREAGYAEIQRIISDEEPVRPSTAVSRMNGRLRTVASNRRSEQGSLTKLIKGDLDWIVLKAIDKDRNRRYETANGLAADLQRHLTDEPVAATPPSKLYRLSKFVRRNRVVVAAGLFIAAALVIGLTSALIGLDRARRAEWATEEQRQRAVAEARQARQNLYFAEIKLADQALAEKNPGHALKLLEQHIPADETAEDFRGWEWHYLWNQVRPDPAVELGRHETQIRSSAFSPSGGLAASSDFAGNIQVWDFATRRRLYHYEAGNIVHQILFYSEDILLAADGAGKLTFHDVRQDALLRTLDLRAPVRAIALSPRRDQLAVLTGAYDVPAKTTVWALSASSPEQPVATLSPMFVFKQQEPGFWPFIGGALAYSPSGKELAAADVDGRVRIYDTSSGVLREVLRAYVDEDAISTLAYSTDGRWLASNGQRGTNDHDVIVWETRDWQEVAVLSGHARAARQVMFSPHGESLLVVSGDQMLRQWNTADWLLRRSFQGHQGPLTALALHPSGRLALTGGNDTRLLAWDLTRLSARLEPVMLPRLRAFEFSPSGDSLATIEADEDGLDTHRVGLRAAPDFQVHVEVPSLGEHVVDVAFSPDGRRLAALSIDAVRLWDLEDNQMAGEGSLLPSDSRFIAEFTPDGLRLLLVDREFTVFVWDVTKGTIVDSWSARGGSSLPEFFDKGTFAFHSPSDTLVIGGTGQAWVWDTESRSQRGVLEGHGIWQVEPAISPDGDLIATLGEAGDRQVRLWNAHTLQLVGDLDTPPHPIFCPAFSPERGRLVMGLYKFGSLGIYDVRTGIQILAVPPGPAGVTRRCQWSPEGTTLMAVGEGGGIIWRTSSALER